MSRLIHNGACPRKALHLWPFMVMSLALPAFVVTVLLGLAAAHVKIREAPHAGPHIAFSEPRRASAPARQPAGLFPGRGSMHVSPDPLQGIECFRNYRKWRSTPWLRAVARCRLAQSFDDVLKIQTGLGADSEIETLQALDDSPEAVSSFLTAHSPDLAPPGRACLLLYGREAYGEEWYEGAREL
jgi:hypothetical protein